MHGPAAVNMSGIMPILEEGEPREEEGEPRVDLYEVGMYAASLLRYSVIASIHRCMDPRR